MIHILLYARLRTEQLHEYQVASKQRTGVLRAPLLLSTSYKNLSNSDDNKQSNTFTLVSFGCARTEMQDLVSRCTAVPGIYRYCTAGHGHEKTESCVPWLAELTV